MSTVSRSLSSLVLRRPWLTLLISLGLGALFVLAASGLNYDTRFSGLLPDSALEVLEVEALKPKAGGTVEQIIAVSGADHEARMAFSRRVVERLRQKPWTHRADVEYPVDFFLDRRLMLLSTDKLRKLEREIDEDIDRAKARANPLYVDLEDDEEQGQAAAWSQLDPEASGGKGIELLKRHYSSSDGKYLFIRVKPYATASDMAAGQNLRNEIRALVASADPGREGLQVGYAGSLEVNQEQHQTMSQDLRRAAIIALVAILTLLTIFVRRLATPLVLAVPLLLGVAATLAFTALTIGRLNLVSGFLVSALFGLGIDFEIHLYLRYLERLRLQPDRRQAMSEAIARTLPACMTAAGTTAAAFFAMAISDFRGYREYGLVAGAGVLLTLLMAYVVLPPLAVMLVGHGRKPRPSPVRGPLRRGLAWSMVAVGAGFFIFSLVASRDVRWHNDFGKMKGTSSTVEFSNWVSDELGGSLSPAAFWVPGLAQARVVEDYLSRQASRPDRVLRDPVSLASMIPRDVQAKLPVLKRLQQSLAEVLDEDLEAGDEKRVKEALGLARVKPWGVKDIPSPYRRLFEAADGDGQFVAVWPAINTDLEANIIHWGAELNRMRAELRAMGIPVQIMDENRVAGRVLSQMHEDTPWVLGAASVVVLLLLVLDFRDPRKVLLVAGALGVGVTWMLGLMALLDVNLNVFNHAVLATIIGVGIDNVVHIMHRYQDEGPGSIQRVVSTTGAAALLSSATTAIGFGAMVTARHLGLNSMGWLSLLGLTAAFAASTIFFPALLQVLERRADRRLPTPVPGETSAPMAPLGHAHRR